MTSHRIAQVNEVLRHEISAYLTRYFEPPRGTLVTIEEVSTTADLAQAKIFVSVLPVDKAASVVRDLNARRHDVLDHTKERLPFRLLPALTFIVDTREEKAASINRLLDESS